MQWFQKFCIWYNNLSNTKKKCTQNVQMSCTTFKVLFIKVERFIYKNYKINNSYFIGFLTNFVEN